LAIHYLDTSALVKLYVRESGTDVMLQLANSSSNLAVLDLTRVEFHAVVRRRQRMGDVSHDIARTLIDAMDHHLQTLYWVPPVTEAVIEEAIALLDRHPLRAYDALQLAGCVSLRAQLREQPIFVCADRQLLRAAEREGLDVLDPAAVSEA
jgi:uncharacterized protein